MQFYSNTNILDLIYSFFLFIRLVLEEMKIMKVVLVGVFNNKHEAAKIKNAGLEACKNCFIKISFIDGSHKPNHSIIL